MLVAPTVVDDADQVGLVSAMAVMVTVPEVPVSTAPALLSVVIVEVSLPAVVVLVIPLIWTEIASFEMIGLAYNLDNRLVGGFSKNYNLPFKPDVYQTLMKQGINIPSEIEIKKQGIYNLRVVVRNKVTGSALSASEWVESN